MERHVLVDGDNLIHRSHAIFVLDKFGTDIMTAPNGYPTGLIYGALSMLGDWLTSISNPTKLVFFLDGRPSRRLGLDPGYKQEEEEKPRPWKTSASITLSDGFVANSQLDLLVHILCLLGFEIYHHPEEEADDLMASYVSSKPDVVHIVVSSDKDFYQLLDGNERVVLYRPGVSGNRFFDAEKAEEHMLKLYKVRVPPSNVRMFKALTGDPSDGIVGIPRLRKKVAAPLCRFRNIDELYASGLPGLSPSEREKTEAMRERIRLNFELVGLVHSLNVESCRQPGDNIPNFQVALKILREDLDIRTVHPHMFQVSQPGRLRVSAPTSDLIPDFLSDI